MSPYILVISMEYFQRELEVVIINNNFHFHPRYKQHNISHICFIDDLLMFFHAELSLVHMIKQTLDKLLGALGFQTNCDKSSVYFLGAKT